MKPPPTARMLATQNIEAADRRPALPEVAAPEAPILTQRHRGVAPQAEAEAEAGAGGAGGARASILRPPAATSPRARVPTRCRNSNNSRLCLTRITNPPFSIKPPNSRPSLPATFPKPRSPASLSLPSCPRYRPPLLLPPPLRSCRPLHRQHQTMRRCNHLSPLPPPLCRTNNDRSNRRLCKTEARFYPTTTNNLRCPPRNNILRRKCPALRIPRTKSPNNRRWNPATPLLTYAAVISTPVSVTHRVASTTTLPLILLPTRPRLAASPTTHNTDTTTTTRTNSRNTKPTNNSNRPITCNTKP